MSYRDLPKDFRAAMAPKPGESPEQALHRRLEVMKPVRRDASPKVFLDALRAQVAYERRLREGQQ